MTKFKHGDRVTCKIAGTEITDARISIDRWGTPFICQNEKDGAYAEDKLGYKYSWALEKDFTNSETTDLKLVEKTLDNLEVGDVIVIDSQERTILGICGKIYFLSYSDNRESCLTFRSLAELKKLGYKPKSAVSEIPEMTVEEICKELGREVKIKK